MAFGPPQRGCAVGRQSVGITRPQRHSLALRAPQKGCAMRGSSHVFSRGAFRDRGWTLEQ
eukprot:4051451-Alexandrium_andersonii.AAC.1